MLSSFVLCSLLALPAQIADPAHEFDDGPAAPHCAHAKLLKEKLREGLPTPADLLAPAELLTDTDVLDYNLDIVVTPSPANITGSNTMTVKSLVPTLTQFSFWLDTTFTISSITISGTPCVFARPDPTNTPQLVLVTLDRAYTTNEVFAMRVAYSGTPQSSAFGSITFGTQNSQPLVCTLSETRFAYTWWPVKEDNNDKATGSMNITVPANLVVASNGLLQGVDNIGSPTVTQKKYRWRTNLPTAPYLFCFSTTNYNRFQDTWTYGTTTMPLDFYIYPASDNTTNRNAWLLLKQHLTTISDKYGIYPFTSEKYGVCQFAFSGGMEHQTMTGQGGSGTTPFGQSLNVHEMGHQWWGDNVTCATWNDIWLNEGFASYTEVLWYENRPSTLGLNGLAQYKISMNARRPTAVNDSVYVYDASIANENRIFSQNFSYYKGAWALSMLRKVMGDTNFFAALAQYRALYSGKAATTAQFRAVCESVHGSSLNWFFNQWIMQIGAPTYNYAVRPVTINGQSYAELYIKQVQSATWPTFTMPIDLKCTTTGADVTLVAFNDAREEHLLLPSPRPVTGGALDPDEWILAVPSSTSTSTTNNKVVVAFVEGPPKVIAVTPAPSASAAAATIGPISITFHKPVNVSASSFTLTRGSNSVPFTFAYNATTQTATLTPTSTLAAGAYTLTALATITDTAASKTLDGEFTSALPSGNGLPGGNFVSTFTVLPTRCNRADVAGLGGSLGPDGTNTPDDLLVFLNAFFNNGTTIADIASLGGGLTPDGQLTVDDLVAYLSFFFAACD
jgi:hypothetical protein